ncbi:hypothetical protein LX99_04629 [Mucilaginibacter oryzae]|uniref:Uncharacterized protein n=1 Tax=Mucilaginibacter oryzae TaxID=468058 RepID=A0A316GYF5_9SPHI|nr:hypothetical protein [Mucilaginibacter oryzae]PWK69976.1 hypothetical protein LX99_04629 [Mucilaginibacter oryzae]
MKNKAKRSVYLLLIGTILFSAGMAIPSGPAEKWDDIARGAGAGLFIAGFIGLFTWLLDVVRENK